jgi:pimeloyl-ACP methyl ester carboxylesterase
MDWTRPIISSAFSGKAYHSKTDKSLVEYEGSKSENNSMFVTSSLVLGMKWPTKEEISNIKTPTLILIGETDGIMKNGEELGKLIKGSKVVTIMDSSHNLMLEQPKEVNQMIEDFFN